MQAPHKPEELCATDLYYSEAEAYKPISSSHIIKQQQANLDAKVRRSSRDIRRPKFDDEIVDSGVTVVAKQPTPRKRARRVASTTDESKGVPSKTEVDNVDSRTITAASSSLCASAFSHTPRNTLVSSFSSSAGDLGKRWIADDDLLLIASITWVCDLRTVYSLVKFAGKYSLVDIEERWYQLLYDEATSRAARRRMDSLGRERARAILSRVPFSASEDKLIRSIPSTHLSPLSALEQLLEENRIIFHHARTSRTLEEHWRELKFYGLLCDQCPPSKAGGDDELLQVERTIDLATLVDIGGGTISDHLPLDVEERNLARGLVASEREMNEWGGVLVRAITGIVPINGPMAPDTIAILRGRCVVYDIRKENALIGRSTARHQVDINLTLEGPSARISRRQALLRSDPTGKNSAILYNLGTLPVFVNGQPLIRGDKIRLQDSGAQIEISLLRLQYIKNQAYGA